MRTMGADMGLAGQNSALWWGVANLALDAAGALPCQFPLQRGERALERLSHKPSLPICDRIKRVGGLRRRTGVELHRPSGAMDPRRASRRGRNVRLAARKSGRLGGPAHELHGDHVRLEAGLPREGGHVEKPRRRRRWRRVPWSCCFSDRCRLEDGENLSSKSAGVGDGGGDIADLTAIEIGERAAERENGAEGHRELERTPSRREPIFLRGEVRQ